MLKNVAGQSIGAELVSASDGSAFTGSVTVSVTVDRGTQATGSVGSGACAHEGLGFHSYGPAQAETNGDHIAFTFTGTGAIPVTVQIYTQIVQPTAAEIADAVSTEIATTITNVADLVTDLTTANIGIASIESSLGDALPDSVPADGTRPSMKQALYMVTQFLMERSVSGTTLTVKKADGTTSLLTLTLNDASTPTSITRAT